MHTGLRVELEVVNDLTARSSWGMRRLDEMWGDDDDDNEEDDAGQRVVEAGGTDPLSLSLSFSVTHALWCSLARALGGQSNIRKALQ